MKVVQKNVLNIPDKEAAEKIMDHFVKQRIEQERKINEQVDEKIFALTKTNYKYAYVQTVIEPGSNHNRMKMTKRIIPGYELKEIDNSVMYNLDDLRKEFESYGIDYQNIGYRKCVKLYKIAKEKKM